LDDLDRASQSGGGSEHELASEVSERIRAVISSAEAAANAVRHEAEQRAAVRRRLADEEARRIVEDARRDAEAYLAERIRRISELSDAVVERGEGIVMRLDRAEEVRRQLQGLADALGESAEELARELGEPEAASPRAPKAAAPRERRASAEAIRTEAEAAPASDDASRASEAASPAASTASAADASAEIADDPTVGELASEVEDASPAEPESSSPALEVVRDEPEIDEEPVADAEVVEDERAATSREPDEQLSARLVALQMAVAGGKRDEVETHLKRTFEIDDVGQILDDVFGAGDAGSRAG
jgi:anti-sigma regulatory factor (Ser/Thr protein kinase)